MVVICSGQMMVEQANDYGLEGECIPFNEAMVKGHPHPIIFSDEFNKERCSTHGCTMEQYEEITLRWLKDLKGPLKLCFGYDVFCQLNCLTMMAYLSRRGYEGEVEILIADEDKKVIIDSFRADPKPYAYWYEKLLIRRELVETGNRWLDKAVELWHKYLDKDQETVKGYASVEELMKAYPEFGFTAELWTEWLQ
ncbi:MAG: hypothetical protein HUJ57_05035 [Erysipelotrichaceae bacterium]|nr:hypothetical protein [Erysipelotrichaceae bacterium]